MTKPVALAPLPLPFRAVGEADDRLGVAFEWPAETAALFAEMPAALVQRKAA